VRIEILQYRLMPGTRAVFASTIRHESEPLHRDVGISVLFHGPVAGDADGYVLVRCFSHAAAMEQQLAALYHSPAWRNGPRQRIVDAIAETHQLIVDVPEANDL
jgi:hypothetical protein